MLVLKVRLFIAALLFFFIGIAFFSSSDEEIGTPFIILGAAALVVTETMRILTSRFPNQKTRAESE